MDPSLEHLIAHAERLLTRLEAVLPHAPRAPDWDASVAFRYRRRNGNAVLDGEDRGSGIASGEFRIARTPIVKGMSAPMSIDPPLTAYKKIVSAAGALRRA